MTDPFRSGGDIDGFSARLVGPDTPPQRLTFDRVENTRTAMSRALCEYMSGLSIQWKHGRMLSFARVIYTWSDIEDVPTYPSLVVLGETSGEYEDSSLSGHLQAVDDGTDRYVRIADEYSQAFSLIAWCTDDEQRTGLLAMLEDATQPHEGVAGFRLEMPYYFNARATFLVTGQLYLDSDDSVMKNQFRAVLQVKGTMPRIVPVGVLQHGAARFQLDVSDGNAVPSEPIEGVKVLE
jgi:hypothetical protein